MCDFVGIGYHFEQIFVDHVDILISENNDDVLHFPVAQLPPILSPTKCRSSGANVRENEPGPIKIVLPDEEITRLENDNGNHCDPNGAFSDAKNGRASTVHAEHDRAAANTHVEQIAAKEVEAEIRARNAEAVQAEVQRERLGAAKEMEWKSPYL